MTQPSFLTVPDLRYGHRQIIKFGGLPRADTGVVQPFIDLNDADSWFANLITIDGNHISNKSSQLNWRGKAVWTAQDFIGRKITVAANYDEGNAAGYFGAGTSYPAAKGVLTMAGEQYLTFDNLTGIRVRLNSFAQAKPLVPMPPYLWDAPLEFLSRNPFAEDLGGSTVITPPMAVGGSVSATSPNPTIVYGGAAYGEPIVTITAPSAVITGVQVQNTTYPNLNVTAAFTVAATTVTIDSTLFAIIADLGLSSELGLAPVGTFPLLFPGNNVIYAAVQSGGTNCTCSISYASKYEL